MRDWSACAGECTTPGWIRQYMTFVPCERGASQRRSAMTSLLTHVVRSGIVALTLAIVPLTWAAPSVGAQGAPASGAAALRSAVDRHRRSHEVEILNEFRDLLAIPNLANDSANIRRNAAAISAMLQRRGVVPRLLESPTGGPPAVYGELRTPGATRTIVLYAHYDGQPVEPARWATPPWEPTMRDGPLEQGGRVVPMPTTNGVTGPEWRLYARSAGDDKAPIVAMLVALDALRAAGIAPSVNLKFYFDGEEEAGNGHTRALLERHADLLASDGWVFADGPVHQSRRQQVVMGVRGVTDVVITAYGATRALHSGHYGNWAPNPAMMIATLLASMRDDDGRIRIAGYYADVTPVTAAEHRAVRTKGSRFVAESSFGATVTAPVIYSLIVPLILVDIRVSLYQEICFRAYGNFRVRRADYVVLDRQYLAYLNWIEAANCLFCAYANGLVGYVREISSRTEQYWCPINHALKVYDPHKRYHQFLEYGDADGCRARLASFRKQLVEITD